MLRIIPCILHQRDKHGILANTHTQTHIETYIYIHAVDARQIFAVIHRIVRAIVPLLRRYYTIFAVAM